MTQVHQKAKPARRIELGKMDGKFFDDVIYPHLGAKNSSILVPPQHGVDFGAVDLGNGQVMTMSTDPLFIQPSLGFERAAWFAFHIVVSDVAVSGLTPKYITLDWNLPPEMTDEEFETVCRTIHQEAEKLGMSVVTGHTARYTGCNYPMVGGATAMATGPKERLITPKGAKLGNKVIVTKGPAVETVGLLAVEYGEFLAEKFGAKFVEEAQKVFFQMSPIEDAVTAAGVGGVTAMHDATECGVWGGLVEIAEASRVGLKMDKDAIRVQPVIQKTCDFFGIDPFKAISEGTLLLTCDAVKANDIVRALAAKNIPAYIAGDVVAASEGLTYTTAGEKQTLEHPRLDPFWFAFVEYAQKKAARMGTNKA